MHLKEKITYAERNIEQLKERINNPTPSLNKSGYTTGVTNIEALAYWSGRLNALKEIQRDRRKNAPKGENQKGTKRTRTD